MKFSDINIEALQNGSEWELKKFYQKYFPYFLSFTSGYLGSEDQARDVVQDVFIAYWKIRENFTDPVSLKVFFYRSLRNKALNILKRKDFSPTDIEVVRHLESDDFLEESVMQEELSMIVREEIEMLTPQARKVLKLSLEGKTNQEIANALSLSLSTVKTHKIRAYSHLRERLKDVYTILSLLTGF